MSMSTPARLALAAALCLSTLACGSTNPSTIADAIGREFPLVAGQVPPSYQLEPARGVILARVVVSTDGEPGFGGISNPLLLEFQAAGEHADPPRLDPPASGTHVWAAASQRPSIWHYESPGLLAMSVVPDRYGALAIAYPDATHEADTPTSIPVPSTGLVFGPIDVPATEIVYVGDIEIRQSTSAWGWFADQIDVTYAVRDDYDRTVADFRARYPQFATVEVQRRLVRID